MASFLRDEQVSNLTINSEAISTIANVFAGRLTTMPEFLQTQEGESSSVFLTYTIRFDQKGYRLFDKEQFLNNFNQAADVERIIFELASGESLRSNRLVGSFLELRLDQGENAISFLIASSDDVDWMNGSFSAVKEELYNYRNRHSLFRNPWVKLLIQMAGVFIGFLVSLWGASKIAPNLTIENAFLISFLLVLLVFSNLWAPINKMLHGVVYRAFPSISFYRPEKDRLHWLKQAVTAGMVVAATLYILGLAFKYIGKMLGAFVGNGT